MGHAGFYRRFIKYFSALARPLCTLLAKDVPFTLSQACDIAFTKLKNMLVSPPIMRSPNWDLPFEIMCDASDYAIGAVLGQREDKKIFCNLLCQQDIRLYPGQLHEYRKRVSSCRLCPRKI